MMDWSTTFMIILILAALGFFVFPTVFGTSPLITSKKVLVLFYADWCGYCQKLKPSWSQLMEGFQGINGCQILAINADENPDLVAKHQVKGFPTIKFFPYGLEDTRCVDFEGNRDFQTILAFAKRVTL